MTRIYSKALTAAQNAAFERFENLTSHAPFGIEDLERGEIKAEDLRHHNVQWLAGVASDAEHIPFPT